MPAEGFQHFFDEALGICFVQAAVALALFGQGDGAVGENVALGEGFLSLLAQGGVVNQFQTQ